ncbi:MAG: hypothetical protein IPI46_04840 [Bacteroidetes bacterium]|nr:hypothetical protein [Bacteroidota bacterium]
MKSYIKISVISICIVQLLVSFFGCKKQVKLDTQKPTITLVEPTEDTLELSIEPEIHIEFTVTDNEQLQLLQVDLLESTGANIFSQSTDVSGLSVYPFHAHLTPSIGSAMPMELRITANDKNQNVVSMVKTFVVIP